MSDEEALQQRRIALAKANEIRIAIAEEKRKIRAMTHREAAERMAEMLLQDPDLISSVQMDKFLTWPRGSGAAAARRMLRRWKMPPGVRLGVLSEDSRRFIASEIRNGFRVRDLEA